MLPRTRPCPLFGSLISHAVRAITPTTTRVVCNFIWAISPNSLTRLLTSLQDSYVDTHIMWIRTCFYNSPLETATHCRIFPLLKFLFVIFLFFVSSLFKIAAAPFLGRPHMTQGILAQKTLLCLSSTCLCCIVGRDPTQAHPLTSIQSHVREIILTCTFSH
jgi:hypothetical protein